MDTTYSKAVALAVPVFLALIALEFTVDRVKRTRYYHLAVRRGTDQGRRACARIPAAPGAFGLAISSPRGQIVSPWSPGQRGESPAGTPGLRSRHHVRRKNPPHLPQPRAEARLRDRAHAP